MNNLHKFYWFLTSQIGIDLLKMLRAFSGMMRYLRDLLSFSHNYSGRLNLLPCLHDWFEEGGATKNEYFWQDLIVARKIFAANPQKHVDIGSRLDGFVAHVASFREIEVFDVRPITTQIPGVIFKQADLMDPLDGFYEYCDSVSCLHALEHFGLGRYGDPVDPHGFKRGFSSITNLLKAEGIFYLSVPIGIPLVEFNAHRISDPRVILDLAKQSRLFLSSLSIIRQGGIVESIKLSESQVAELAKQDYSLGLFTFVKRI